MTVAESWPADESQMGECDICNYHACTEPIRQRAAGITPLSTLLLEYKCFLSRLGAFTTQSFDRAFTSRGRKVVLTYLAQIVSGKELLGILERSLYRSDSFSAAIWTSN